MHGTWIPSFDTSSWSEASLIVLLFEPSKVMLMSPGNVIGSGDNWMLDMLIGAPGGAENKRHRFFIYYVMKYRKILIKYNAYISQPWKYKNLYFHSSENTRFDIFTGEKPLFLFSQYGLREATLYGICVSFLRETTIGVSFFMEM